jgi:diguanylate cyclase (GGDEF)-like protein/PAS domain S-box-containing protein
MNPLFKHVPHSSGTHHQQHIEFIQENSSYVAAVRGSNDQLLGVLICHFSGITPPGIREENAMAILSSTVSVAIERLYSIQDFEEADKRFEEENEEHVRYRHRIWRNSMDLLLAIAPDGVIRSINPAFTSILGYEPGDLVGKSFGPFVHPDDVQPTIAAITHAMRSPLEYFEMRIRHKLGSFRWFAWRAVSEDGIVYANGRDISDEVLTKTKLSELAEENRALIENSLDIIALFDHEGRILRINSAVEEITGYKTEELVGRPYFDFISPDYANLTIMADAYGRERKGKFQDFENAWVHKNGNLVRLSWSVRFSDDGHLMYATGRDITERYQAQEELQKSKRRITALLESIGDAFFALDNEWRITYVNEKTAEFLGYMQKDLLGKIAWEAVPEFLESSVFPMYKNAMATRQPVIFEGYWEPKQTWAEVRIYPNEEGLAVFFQDVTERRASQHALQTSEERFKLVAKATSDAIWDWDLKTDAIWWNKNLLKLFGFRPDEVEKDSTSWTSRIHPMDKDRITESIHSAISSQEETWSGEYRFVCKDGSYAYVLDRGYIMRDPQGTAIRMVGCMTDLTDQKKSELEIHTLAYYDTLTGLPNRRFLLERLNARLSSGASRGRNGALLFMDLDNFKGLNDTYGHDQGDELLRQVASRLTSCMRGSDIVARLGGDEFVVLVETLNENLAEAMNQSELVAQKIQNAFKPSFRIASSELYTTPSIGIALLDSKKSAFEILKCADIAMYQAKSDGRNAICLYNPEIELSMSAKMQLETDIRVGLLNNQFMLHFQPQINNEGRLVGAEALARWAHPVRGFVPPSEFIANAEESGFIIELGEWILREGCRQLVQWARHPELNNMILAINVSVKQFQHPAFVDMVLDVLIETGADASKLELELTESMLLEDAEAAIKKMMMLKKHGIHFSLDDFGTGYSSLIYLKRLPIEKLKIDQSFVRDIFTDENSETITKTIIALGKNLGLTVLAEGVEKLEQQDWLALHGCEVYQGYLFSRPINEVEFIAYAIEDSPNNRR